ncbi:MAG: MBL fold metallo-hydrolase [Chloroflexi bacterium]|nr:MBL fold metallo-hydrolase [Chloroflexota bacterium]
MRIKFWGTRGSIPVPGAATLRYGGNTACLQVITDDNTLIIIDCGTGIRNLGHWLDKHWPHPIRGHILLSHLHWDHIQGFPFFVPAFRPENEFAIYGPQDMDRRLDEVFAGQMEYPYFPLRLRQLPARLTFHELTEGSFQIDNIEVTTLPLHHTSLTLGYRLQINGSVLVYASDTEPHAPQRAALSSYVNHRLTSGHGEGDRFTHEGNRRLASFAQCAQLLIHDAQYTAEEYTERVGWGHSSVDYAVDVAVEAQVGQLALFHHDPDHTDQVIERLERYAQERAAQCGAAMRVFAAAEGQELRLGRVDQPVQEAR